MGRPMAAFTAPPAPGMRNSYLVPRDHTQWYSCLRVDNDRWVLTDHYRTVATVGEPYDIALGLIEMPVAPLLEQPIPGFKQDDPLLRSIVANLL